MGPTRFGLESQVPAHASLRGYSREPWAHLPGVGRCHFPFPQKDCPAGVPAPHFSFQHAFLDRDALSPPTFPENLLGFALQALSISHSQEYEQSKGKKGMGSGLSLPESESQL